MKSLLLALLFSLSMTLPNLADSATPSKRQHPLAVLISADWCYNCKQIRPKLAEARKEFGDAIEFISLDVTDDARFAKARGEAERLGIGYLLQGQFATGWVALVDRSGHKVDELHQQMSVDQMQEALRRLAAAPG